jgi:hypothetical protein
MSDNETKTSPAVGLDIGTSRIVTANKNGDSLSFQSQLNAFVNVPFSRMAEKALTKEDIPFTRRNGELVVHGNESVRFADLLGLEARRPMTAGILNPTELESTTVIGTLVETMLGEEEGDGRPLFYSVPAAPLDGRTDLTYHSATLRDIVAQKGYEVQSIDEGLTVVYSELEDTNYTGIGVSCGGGLCNICLAYLSLPIISFSVPKGGDFIDASAASVTGEGSTRIRLAKEKDFHFNGSFPNQVHQALGVYYDDMIQTLVDAMKRAFASSSDLPKFSKPTPIVLSGGTSMPKGFASRFEKALRANDFPLQISQVRTAQNPLEATAKGALVAALAEC